MQGFSRTASWTEPTGTLGELTRNAHARAEQAVRELANTKARALDLPAPPSFADALRGSKVALIAEVKRFSPSKGAIAPMLDAVEQARIYERGGASAVSVLTEPERFGGSLSDLDLVSSAIGIPALRKDFIVHPVQLWEARAHGASAALLIMRALAPGAYERLLDEATEAGLDILTEIRDEAELDRALAADASIIGVNNRNLETLVIDTTTAPRVIPAIPAECIAIAESGIVVPEDARAAIDAGADALLVGSSLSASRNPMNAVSALCQFTRRRRSS